MNNSVMIMETKMKKYIYFVSFYSEFNKRVSNTQIELDCKIGDLSKVQSVEKYIAKHSLYKDPKIITYALLREEETEDVQLCPPLEITITDRYILQEILHNLSIGITLIPNIKKNIKSEFMNKYHGKVNPNIISELIDDKFKP